MNSILNDIKDLGELLGIEPASTIDDKFDKMIALLKEIQADIKQICDDYETEILEREG